MKKLAAILATACLVLGMPQIATALPLSNPNSEIILYFDLTSLNPTPDYNRIRIKAYFSPNDPVNQGIDRLANRLYGDINGVDLIQTRYDTECNFFGFHLGGFVYGPVETSKPIYDAMLDGVFSLSWQTLEGSAQLMSITACGVNSSHVTTCMNQLAPAAEVADPATLALLGLGFVRFRHAATSALTSMGRSIVRRSWWSGRMAV